MDKKARDNRANQMNPNNPAYYKSRMGSSSKKNSKKTNGNDFYKQQNKHTKNNSTKVVHHHHHHNHVEREYIVTTSTPQPSDNSKVYVCPYCGTKGSLRTTLFGSVKCSRCGSKI